MEYQYSTTNIHDGLVGCENIIREVRKLIDIFPRYDGDIGFRSNYCEETGRDLECYSVSQNSLKYEKEKRKKEKKKKRK